MRVTAFVATSLLFLHPATAAASEPPEATVLVVTSADLEDAWLPFAAWKTALGKRTKILSTESIAAEYEGRDLQEKIRVCIRHHVENFGTTAVILGGDSSPDGGVVPDRDTDHNTMWGPAAGIPTDIYYLSKGSWDADEDGKFGEWKDDASAIDYPDGSVGLGRIPVRTAADVSAFTAKVVSYESRYPEDAFAEEMIITCPVPQAYPKLKRSWDDHIAKAWTRGNGQQFFADRTPWDKAVGGDFALSPQNWIELVNRKEVGKFHLHGHGLQHCWVLENNAELNLDGIQQLLNRDAYPVITTVSCFTGEFDAENDPCIAEQMLRLPNAGAVIIVAPSREGKPHFHDPRTEFPLMMSEGKPDGTTLTMARFWANGLGENIEAGRALMTAKAGMAEDARKSANFHLCLCELNLLGDPTLDLRASNPRIAKASLPEKIAAERQVLKIQTNAPGARVCAWKPGEVYVVAVSDGTGLATIEIAPKTEGEMSLTVSGLGLNALSGSIQVGSSNSK